MLRNYPIERRIIRAMAGVAALVIYARCRVLRLVAPCLGRHAPHRSPSAQAANGLGGTNRCRRHSTDSRGPVVYAAERFAYGFVLLDDEKVVVPTCHFMEAGGDIRS